MEKMSPEEGQKIVDILIKKGATLPCPRCGNKNYTLLEGYFNQIVQNDIQKLALSGFGIPSVIVACTNCGYMSNHSLGILGLMPVSGERK